MYLQKLFFFFFFFSPLSFSLSLCCLFLSVPMIRPFSPGLGEAQEWVYPQDKRNKHLDDYDEEDLHVRLLREQFSLPAMYSNMS